MTYVITHDDKGNVVSIQIRLANGAAVTVKEEGTTIYGSNFYHSGFGVKVDQNTMYIANATK